MAQEENGLGAPTEGLGQTVTFDYKLDTAGIPVLQGSSPMLVRGGVRGGDVRTAVDPGGRAPTSGGFGAVAMDLIGMAGGIARPIVDQKRKEAYVGGMVRAAQGEAVTDIVNEQPWYANIFGQTDAVEGARAYTAQAKMADLAGALEDGSETTRSMDPMAATKFYQGQLQSAMTGDAATDAATMQAYGRMMPAVMRKQAKDHLAWKQERAVVAEEAAFSAGVDLLQRQGTALGQGKITPDEFAVAKSQFVFDIAPPAGINADRWMKSRVNGVKAALAKGQLHAVNAMEETGMIAALPAAYQDDIAKARKSAEGTLESQGKEWAYPQLMDFNKRASVGDVPDASSVSTVLNHLNNEWARRTGSKTPLFAAEEINRKEVDVYGIMVRKEAAAIKARQDNEKAARTEADKLEARRQTVQAVASGLVGSGMLPSGATDSDKEDALQHIRETIPEAKRLPVYRQMFYASGGMVDKVVANTNKVQIESALMSKNPDTFQGAYQRWAQFNAVDPNMAAAYTGDDKLARRMETYHRMTNGGGYNQGAFDVAFNSNFAPSSPSSKEAGARVKAVADKFSYFVPSWMGDGGSDATVKTADGIKGVATERIDMPTAQAERMAQAYQHDISAWAATNMDQKAATDRALSLARARGEYSTIGGFFIRNQGAVGDSIEQHLVNKGLPTNRVGSSFKDAMFEALDEIGVDDKDSAHIIRTPDKNGELYFTVLTSEGKQLGLTGQQIISHWGKKRAALKPTDYGDSRVTAVMQNLSAAP